VLAAFMCFMAAVSGVASLRLSYGRAYFASWDEVSTLSEMERLYCLRTRGGQIVLRAWRNGTLMFFAFDIIVVLWLRYMLDLLLDLQAMRIFLEGGDYWFFAFNLIGILLGLVWTAYEIGIRVGLGEKDAEADSVQIMVIGITLMCLGSHVTFLAGLSLYRGVRHPFLFISTLAEAILESAVSAGIQSYALIVNNAGMSFHNKLSLYLSVGMSFISIGYAFSTLDKIDGGNTMASLPGFSKSNDFRWLLVFAFRVMETTSRVTSLVLFFAATKPYHGMEIWLGSTVILTFSATVVFQYRMSRSASGDRWNFVRKNLFYCIPSVICLMSPMLEQDPVLTMPPSVYYTMRFLELSAMGYAVLRINEFDLDKVERFYCFDNNILVSVFVVSTVLMFLLCVIIRLFLTVSVVLELQSDTWFSRPFGEVQQALRNSILKAHAGSPEVQQKNHKENGAVPR
jgi:hypothetical protein